jgi:hypothetical protein
VCLKLYQCEKITWWCLSVLESILESTLQSTLKFVQALIIHWVSILRCIKITFYPYMYVKDSICWVAFAIFSSIYVFISPNVLGHLDSWKIY